MNNLYPNNLKVTRGHEKVTRTKYILSFFILVLVLQSVYAIGITPGRTTIDFEPNLQKEVSFSVTNAEQKEMSIVFYTKGELKEAVSLNQDRA